MPRFSGNVSCGCIVFHASRKYGTSYILCDAHAEQMRTIFQAENRTMVDNTSQFADAEDARRDEQLGTEPRCEQCQYAEGQRVQVVGFGQYTVHLHSALNNHGDTMRLCQPCLAIVTQVMHEAQQVASNNPVEIFGVAEVPEIGGERL